MALPGFMGYLEAANDPLDLAQRLGETCLKHEGDLAELMGQPRSRKEVERLELWTGQVSYATWQALVDRPDEFEGRFGSKVMAALRRARTRHPMDLLGILRGLCHRALGEFFSGVEGQVELDRGMPLPFAVRPLPDRIEASELTTALDTLNNANLLEPLPFDLYGQVASGQVKVVLDFADRDEIDSLGWSEEEGLPKIATLHPHGGGDYQVEEIDEAAGTFFGVRPKSTDLEEIEALLARAKEAGARVAVLPELSLERPDQLEEMLARRQDFPPLVIAGSAHAVISGEGEGALRVNESRVYLTGRFVAIARKHHAFKTGELEAKSYNEPLLEGITREPKTIMVLAGSETRVAVAICADLIGRRIPSLLVDAGVNLLLAPAMTPELGSFNPPLADIAGYCQGVAAVANTRWDDSGEPFLCMCAVPRKAPTQQSAALAGDGGNPAPTLALINPNEPLPDGVRWLRLVPEPEDK